MIEAATASGAWATVGKRINDLKENLTGKRTAFVYCLYASNTLFVQ